MLILKTVVYLSCLLFVVLVAIIEGNAECNIVFCKANPCDVSTCPAYPDAVCSPNYCGGCFAVWAFAGSDVTNLC